MHRRSIRLGAPSSPLRPAAMAADDESSGEGADDRSKPLERTATTTRFQIQRSSPDPDAHQADPHHAHARSRCPRLPARSGRQCSRGYNVQAVLHAPATTQPHLHPTQAAQTSPCRKPTSFIPCRRNPRAAHRPTPAAANGQAPHSDIPSRSSTTNLPSPLFPNADPPDTHEQHHAHEPSPSASSVADHPSSTPANLCSWISLLQIPKPFDTLNSSESHPSALHSHDPTSITSTPKQQRPAHGQSTIQRPPHPSRIQQPMCHD
ncbi:hypothetical protein ACLOJK_021697 [Asimina triloba]